ncbi:MAG: chitobiase/beta-hexosaminidase C-terminal domain-containing protein [Bacteroidales bacterium]|nr:chitobiase/beta-hexosaminidase C-terminal domain-containing protein [Bacteroidales bacterium]
MPVYLYHYVAPTGTKDPELSYSSSSFTIAANVTPTEQPTLSNPYDLTIKYSSSDKSVATVTDKGVIALAGGTGTATITATSQADDTYAVGTATYTLTVFGAPEITPESDEYENNVTVVMNATGAGALFYTTDGTDPRADNNAATKVTDFPYNLPLSVGTHTIKAVTADESLEVYSDVLTRTYTVVLAVPTPQLSQAAGNYNYEVAVGVTVANSGGAVGYVYTTDGTDPATSATATTVNALAGTVTLYEGEHTLTVKSFTAEKANFSDAATAAYTVSLPQPVITLSAESTQEQPITVTIEAEGAPYIWYTTDGTDPLANGATPVQVEGSSTIVTLTEVGTYTITAVGVNNNVETSAAATATCTINKVIPVPGSAAMKYKKVTSMDDIVDGGVYLLACPSRGYAMSFRYPSKTYTGAGALSFPDGEDNILLVENLNTSNGPCEITLEKVADKENVYYLRYANGGDYIYSASSNDSNLGFSDKLPATQIERYEWKISFVERQISRQNTDKVTALSCLSNYSSRCLDINWSATPVRYATYKYDVNNNAPSFLYKKTFDLSVNANTAGYATAYTAFPYVMPTGADGYIVTETAEGATIKAKNKYPAGAEVPANAPLLIKNSEAGVTLNPVVLGKTVEAYPYADENLLHGTRLESDGVTTDVDGTDNYYYYKLSYKLDAEKNPVAGSYGFYRGKANGSAFEMKNTLTAYLALPKSRGLVNNLRISIDNEEGPTTGIQANRLPADNMPQSVYTLSGVRVNAEGNRLPKGIYIVNGKKVVIK